MTAMQQAAAPSATTDKKTPLQPLGPDSLMWKDFGAHRYQLILQQAFILQSAHPVINAAVTKEKKYKYDPWGRARNSVALLWPVVYSRPEQAIAMGHRLREVHRPIKGVDKNGEKYHALDPEAYSWVHITGYDAIVRLHDIFGTPLTPDQRRQAFEEWKKLGGLLGVADKYIPQTEAEYWKQYNYIINERLQWGEALDDLLDPWSFARWPKPPNAKYLPTFAWKMLAVPMSLVIYNVTVATLPENFRARFNLRMNPLQKLAFRLFVGLVKIAGAITPESMKYIPLAKRAFDDARKHPEAYRYQPETTKDTETAALASA